LPRDFLSSVERGDSTESGCEQLDDSQRGPEALMLGLRLTSGVDLGALARLHGEAFLVERAPRIEELVQLGLLERYGSWLRLTERSTMVGNDVICRLL
jgi:coproporphyrinogen III oxidase-like Fe-S oxidoreductase